MNKRTLYNTNDLGKSFGLAVAMMLAGSFVLSLVFMPFADASGNLPDWAFWLMQALYTLIIGSTAFVYAAIAKVDVSKATTINRPPKIAHVGWGCLATLFLIAFMLPINELLMKLLVAVGLPEPSVDLPLQIVPLILISCVMAAVTEEMTFRGTVAMTLANNGKLAALAISGALFALFHTNPAQTVHQFVLGAFLTLLLLRSGSVWTTVLVHFFNNIVAIILTFTPLTDEFFVDYWYVFLPVGLMGFAACIFGYLKTTSSNWNPSASVSGQDATTNAPAMDIYSQVFFAIGVAACAIMWIFSLVGWL